VAFGRWAAFSVPLPTELVDELIPWVAPDGGFPAVPTEGVDELIQWVAAGGGFPAVPTERS